MVNCEIWQISDYFSTFFSRIATGGRTGEKKRGRGMESFSGKVGWVRKGEMEDGRKGGGGGELLLGKEEGG